MNDIASYFDELLAMPPPPSGIRVPRSRRRRPARRVTPLPSPAPLPPPTKPATMSMNLTSHRLPCTLQCTGQIIRNGSTSVPFAPQRGRSVQSPYFAFRLGLSESEHGRRLFTVDARRRPQQAMADGTPHRTPTKNDRQAELQFCGTCEQQTHTHNTLEVRFTIDKAANVRGGAVGDEDPSAAFLLHDDLLQCSSSVASNDVACDSTFKEIDPFADISLVELENVRLLSATTGNDGGLLLAGAGDFFVDDDGGRF